MNIDAAVLWRLWKTTENFTNSSVSQRHKYVEVTVDGSVHRLFVSYWPLEKSCWIKFDVNELFSYTAYFSIKPMWSRTKGRVQAIDKTNIVRYDLKLHPGVEEEDVEHFFMMASLSAIDS